jgi:hypothetical protein
VITISLKFCGGCNPAYDRTRLSLDIQTALAGRCRFVGSGVAHEADGILIIHGFATACADCDSAHAVRTTHIRNRADALAFIQAIRDIAKPV